MVPYVLIWGGGDLASGVALRLHRAGIRVLVVERDQPLAVRRSVSFCQAVYDGDIRIEDVTGRLVVTPSEMMNFWGAGEIPVLVDPDLDILKDHPALALVDARMRKKQDRLDLTLAEMVIGLGPGFTVGENCHAAVETNRGHFLGRVYWEGSPEADTGIPGKVQAYAAERVLHAPADGVVRNLVNIGDLVEAGQPVLSVMDQAVGSPFNGVVRGLIHDGVTVRKGMKVGDVDPRPEPFRCWYVSEKSLAIGGGVLEALLTWYKIRSHLWEG
ncbi:MAG TPA: EF2563 family selenium-dependent molybdenum hydroxylase system protein [Anaerolineaceae bacterium]|jgi:xanthine dehydrogenase accessory factor|nr:EF2563 family selenium-dependent molybdenum hydroxylase system protein [Anaerolineaceae bacterium]